MGLRSHILQVKWRGRLIAWRAKTTKGTDDKKENDRNNNVLFCKIVIELCFSLEIPFPFHNTLCLQMLCLFFNFPLFSIVADVSIRIYFMYSVNLTSSS